MAALLNNIPDPVAPSPMDTQLAQEASRRLTRILGAQKDTVQVRILPDGGEEETLAIPLSALRLLADVLTEMARGNAVALIPVRAELTTQQAADLLNVSRPYLIELLEKGEIPFRKVGTHRRVLFHDLNAYKQKTDHKRLQALEELSALDQELGFGY